MARKSPWHQQNGRVVRRLKRVYSKSPKNPSYAEGLDILKRGPETMSIPSKNDFLLRQEATTSRVILNNFVFSALVPEDATKQNFVQKTITNPWLKPAVRDFLVATTARALVTARAKEQTTTARNHYLGYLKARGISVDKKIFDGVVDSFIADVGVEKIASEKVNPSTLEKRYFAELRTQRKTAQSDREFVNLQIRSAAKGIRLTKNQTTSAKRWLIKNKPSFDALFDQILIERARAVKPIDKIIDGKDMAKLREDTRLELFARIQDRLKKELLSTFETKKPKVIVPIAKQTSPGSTKTGTRRERIATYNAQEIRESRATQQEVQRRQEVARIEGIPFDSRTYALMHLDKESPAVGKKLRQLSANKEVLSDSNLTSLFIAGPLAQRTFMSAIDDHAFLIKHAPREINFLARMIASIGSECPKKANIMKRVPREYSKGIYEFLDKAGLLETQHRGGKNVMLRRPNHTVH